MPLRTTLAALLLLPLLGVAAAEALGWPFLKQPVTHFLTRTLDRDVSFEPVVHVEPSVNVTPEAKARATAGTFSIHLLGSVRFRADAFRIAAPAWSKAPFTVSARQFALELRYTDLWRFFRGQRLRIENVQASSLDAHLERLADGRASWQTESSRVTPASSSTANLTLPILNNVPITRGSLKFSDAILESEIDATWSLSDSLSGTTTSGSDAVAIERIALTKHRPIFLMIDATGHYKKLPLSVAIKSSADLSCKQRPL
jgi:AsmA family protein